MELWPAFILGLVGSLHCAGMCGPLALALPAIGNSSATFLFGRVAYNLGRIASYSVLGVIFGLMGRTVALAGFQRWISLVAGIAILVVFASSTKVSLNLGLPKAIGWIKSGLGKLLHRRTFGSLLLLGVLNGFLPCGLVYVACAGAIAEGGFLKSVEYMIVFGLGTFPMMLAIALAGKKFQFTARLRFQKFIPLCAVLLGMLLVLRGLSLGIPYISPDLSANRCCH